MRQAPGQENRLRYHHGNGFITDTAEQLRYATHHYVANVLRMFLGDSIIVFNHNDGEWLGKIYLQDKKKTFIMIQRKLSQS